MKKVKDIETALAFFAEASFKQAQATEQGDYKTGNKYYDIIVKATTFIKNVNAIDSLHQYLSNPSVGVRMWAAYYLLNAYEKESVKVLEEISKSSSIYALTADTTLSEWRKGSLEF
ncbi:DUF2019 domain-containing protein [Flavobacteriaceae bacterium 3-367]